MKKLFIILIVLAFFFGAWGAVSVHAEEIATESASIEEAVPLETQIEMWQEYIDKYIMPNAMAILTGIGMVFAVFSKFKTLLNLYKAEKEKSDLSTAETLAKLKAENEEAITALKADIKAVSEYFQSLGQTLNKSFEGQSSNMQKMIEDMPISAIKESLLANTQDTSITAGIMMQQNVAIADLTEMLRMTVEGMTVSQPIKTNVNAKASNIQKVLADNSTTEVYQNMVKKIGEKDAETVLNNLAMKIGKEVANGIVQPQSEENKEV